MTSRVRAFVIVFLFSASLVSGCARESDQPAPAGTRPFASFEAKQVSDLLISKFDPATGDDWTADVRPPRKSEPDWVFTSAPEGKSLADPSANGGYFAHLLDTLRTLQIMSLAPAGPPESFGLGHPWFALRWTAQGRVFEVRLSAPRDYACYAMISAAGKKDPHVYEVRGAAIRMLEMARSFDYLRHHTWATLSSDEIDEVEITKRGKPWFYAQRDGDNWADRKHRKIKKDVQALVESLAHAQIFRFEDSLAQKDDGSYLAGLKKAPTFEIRLSALGHPPLLLWLSRKNGPKSSHDSDYGGASDRPKALFSLYRSTTDMLEKAR